MNKQEFERNLSKGLSFLPVRERKERIAFYSEIIDDRIEEGLSEEEAVAEVGDIDGIILQILSDSPKPVKRGLKALEIILLILGSPVWLSLLVAFLAVALSLYVSVWAVIISLWAVFASFVGSAVGGVLSGVAFIGMGNNLSALFMLGTASILAGLSVFVFFISKAVTFGVIAFTKKCFKKRRKENE
jgi:uncharacterized membrane protein